MSNTSPKGPSYDEVVKSIETNVGKLLSQATAIRTKFVPAGIEIPREKHVSEEGEDCSLFNSLVNLNLALQDLEIELESVINCF